MRGATPLTDTGDDKSICINNIYIYEAKFIMNDSDLIQTAVETLDIEIEGIEAVKKQLGATFAELVKACSETLDKGGKIVVTGVGKSGHIGRKMAATLASTGSPAIFMHPVEAMHGDLGMLQENDIMLALSYSGETHELTAIILPAKRLGVKVACFTGYATSALAKLSDIAVTAEVPREACPFNLAPTTTSTAHLALGDALAMVLMHVRRFTKEDYGKRHPGGAIGRAVTMRVADVMRTGENVAAVTPETPVKEALVKMTKARCGSAIVVDSENHLLGIFTDGDFRRRVENDLSILSRPMKDVMTPDPICVNADALAVEVLKIIEKRQIDDLPAVDAEKHLCGLVYIQDLPGLKIM